MVAETSKEKRTNTRSRKRKKNQSEEKWKVFKTNDPRKLKSSGKPNGSCHQYSQSTYATWPLPILCRHHTLNSERNPRRHKRFRKRNSSPSMAFMTHHWRPQNLGGQLMGMTRSHYPDETNTSDEVELDDKQVTTDEVKKIIQWRQQVTWTVTKPAKQTVGA